MYSSRIWQFRSLNELFITRLIVPGALHRPKGILVCSVFTQSASPSPQSSQFVSFSGISFTMKLTKRWWREPQKVFVSLKMLRAWSEIIWKMALQVRSFCFFFFSDFIYHEVDKKMMTGTPKSFCVLENASCLIWNYLKNGFASTQFLFFLFFSTSDFELCEFPLPFYILASPVFVYFSFDRGHLSSSF